MDEKRTPFKRNWLREAYLISKGDTKIKPKKEHVIAAMENLIAIKADAEKLRDLMRFAYDEACKKREAQGLPPPIKPKALDSQDAN